MTAYTSIGLHKAMNGKFEEIEKRGYEVFDTQIFWKKNVWYAYILCKQDASHPPADGKRG